MNSPKTSHDVFVIRMDSVEGLSKSLRSYGNTKTFLPGKILFNQLDDIQSIFVIESGLVELAVISKNGSKKIITHCSAGIVLGEMGLFQQYINSTQATVLEKSRINVIPIEEGRKGFFNDPELAALLFKSSIAKLQLTTNQLGIMMLESINTRIAHILLDYHCAEVHLTQEKLASTVGCSRVTATRHLNWLEDQGIIKNRRGRIFILNRQALEDLV